MKDTKQTKQGEAWNTRVGTKAEQMAFAEKILLLVMAMPASSRDLAAMSACAYVEGMLAGIGARKPRKRSVRQQE